MLNFGRNFLNAIQVANEVAKEYRGNNYDALIIWTFKEPMTKLIGTFRIFSVQRKRLGEEWRM